MVYFKNYEVWFFTGSQHLYGEQTLKKVEKHSLAIVKGLNENGKLPVSIKFKKVLTTAESIYDFCLEANTSKNCIGVIAWMHTFSPAKMWIAGLKILEKPLLHLHTQYNRDIPWSEINMDFMNLNQSAHGGREFGFICTRMSKQRKVVTGYWEDVRVHEKINVWMRAASAWRDLQSTKIARLGDNMRHVAVTEGDKVEAQIKLGVQVNGYGIGDLVKYVNEIPDTDVNQLVSEYEELYSLPSEVKSSGNKHYSVRDAARIELGMRAFLTDGDFGGFTTTFEDLHGLKQLPGIAVQRLMADGYGFGAEGDWKTAALLRAMKVMGIGLTGGTSFMEDYTYHFNPASQQVLGAHMLEICPSIADGKPSLEVHPLSIGGKEDPARLVFNTAEGNAVNVSLIDLGNRYRLLLNEVKAVKPEKDLPKLPVARVLWKPEPDLDTAATCWIYGGGAHHTVFSKALNKNYLEDFAEMADVELVVIGSNTNVSDFKNVLRWNDSYYSGQKASR
ncbi:MAG: L-arabinose isomerase [Melioribacteraceae bacterium]|nr:L-arabinose isomerase [Melioribacteraceae bacterium]